MGRWGKFELQEFFSLTFPFQEYFFRMQEHCFLGYLLCVYFFLSIFPCMNFFFCTSRAPPITFLMVHPLVLYSAANLGIISGRGSFAVYHLRRCKNANDPQTGPQMIPVKRKEWRGQQNGKDRGMLWKVELFSLLSLKAHFDLINY